MGSCETCWVMTGGDGVMMGGHKVVMKTFFLE